MEGLDLERIKARSREIRECLAKVRRYVALPDPEFLADERNIYTVMHLLLQAIEGVAGLCMHILAKTARSAPASYAECFAGLWKLGLLDNELTGRLVQMARFRNLLVHRYWDVDPQRVLRYARENLGDFEAFLALVGRLADAPPV
ncbi:MAG: type VII toxin-antitoxin system HepT family RNase toxin [Chloroflexia bacterium]